MTACTNEVLSRTMPNDDFEWHEVTQINDSIPRWVRGCRRADAQSARQERARQDIETVKK